MYVCHFKLHNKIPKGLREMVGNGDEEFPNERCRQCFFGAKFGEIST